MNESVKTLISAMILLSIVSFLLWSCGPYSFSGSTLPSHIRTVAVPLFEDRTAEFGIDQKLTDRLIEAITSDNTLKIGNQRNADSILNGTIELIRDTAGEYNQGEVASDFRVTITVRVSFEDIQKQEVLWDETWMQFGVYDNVETDRDRGIDEALDKLTSDILNRTVSGW
ncbi:LptE family protein [bacterium]|nr:LptE family protein [bacterium]